MGGDCLGRGLFSVFKGGGVQFRKITQYNGIAYCYYFVLKLRCDGWVSKEGGMGQLIGKIIE